MGDQGKHGSIIIQCNLTDGESGDNSTGSTVCENRNEFSGSIKGMRLPDKLLKNGLDPWG